MTTQSRWALPDVVNPTTSVCFTVPVPNNKYHIAAFLGAVFELTKAYSWQNDAAHTALLVAAVWKPIWAALLPQGCDLIQFQQPDDCDLQVSFDGGLTWTTIFNALACAIGAADGEIRDGIADGTLGGPTQPGPGTPPASGMCWNYHVTLQANAPWKAPIALNDNWTVAVTNLSGATYDGTFTPFWYCPDGEWYLLGACGGSPHTESGDPLPTENHMSLIALVGAVYTTVTSYTVPTGSGAVDAVFQVNDSVLSDNGGTIEFDLEICNNTPAGCPAGSDWSHVFDFTAGAHGWTAGSGTTLTGPGWLGGNGGSPHGDAEIFRTFTATEITRITVFVTMSTVGGANSTNRIEANLGGGTVWFENRSPINGTDVPFQFDHDATLDGFHVDFNGGSTSGNSIISKIIVCGKGTDPF